VAQAQYRWQRQSCIGLSTAGADGFRSAMMAAAAAQRQAQWHIVASMMALLRCY
jgi:hypothetical protein